MVKISTIRNFLTVQKEGKITNKKAKEIAESEFDKYRIIQDKLFKSDFDELINNFKTKNKIN